MTYNVFSGT